MCLQEVDIVSAKRPPKADNGSFGFTAVSSNYIVLEVFSIVTDAVNRSASPEAGIRSVARAEREGRIERPFCCVASSTQLRLTRDGDARRTRGKNRTTESPHTRLIGTEIGPGSIETRI